MLADKVKCIYCGKRIEKQIPYCTRCGKDIRSMWGEPEPEPPKELLFCPNPKCHAPFSEGDLFCIQCRNDYAKHPPVPESAFSGGTAEERGVYCPLCGAENDNADLFCDCGCNFRIHPRVAAPPVSKRVFYCAVCGKTEVSEPDGICTECREKSQQTVYYCPECKKNTVTRFGEICGECTAAKPLRGTGDGFRIVR